MTKFFLSSHGHLASGLASSLDILLGGHDRVTVFDAYVDEVQQLVADEIQRVYYKYRCIYGWNDRPLEIY